MMTLVDARPIGSTDLRNDSIHSGEEDLDSTTHLLFFAAQGDVDRVRDLLDTGADINAADYDLRTALHLAASEGKIAVVKLLLDRGAFVNPYDRWGSTPLADAKHYGFVELAKLLQSYGGKISQGGRASPNASELADFEIDASELDFKQSIPIGKGDFGELHVVNWRGTRVAVKTILPSLSSDPQAIKEFRGELLVLQRLRHPNIVQFLGAVTLSQPLMIVTEYLPRGDLHEILTNKGTLDAARCIRFSLDIARGMNYLHQHKPPIVHRDLKPRNLLRDEAGHLKVADFGLSQLLKRTDAMTDYQMTGETTTHRYLAPEIFRKAPYDKSVDVYAFAIIVQEMFEGLPNQSKPEDVAKAVGSQNYRPPLKAKTYPQGMKELIRECWDDDPQKRPTFTKVLERLEALEKHYPTSSSPATSTAKDDADNCKCAIL